MTKDAALKLVEGPVRCPVYDVLLTLWVLYNCMAPSNQDRDFLNVWLGQVGCPTYAVRPQCIPHKYRSCVQDTILQVDLETVH